MEPSQSKPKILFLWSPLALALLNPHKLPVRAAYPRGASRRQDPRHFLPFLRAFKYLCFNLLTFLLSCSFEDSKKTVEAAKSPGGCITRLWSDEDEITLLKGLIAFRGLPNFRFPL
ncbi:DNA-binding storekeeper protein-relatedtranscriptional regulator, partial [Striga asiatica]